MQWNTFGHGKVKDILERQLAVGVFAHAYLFVGPSGIGKKMLAKEFAHAIRNTPAEKADINIQEITVTEDFGVEETRNMLSRLRYKPSSGHYAVTIVDGVEGLNVQSFNSLLKTLEEPTPSSIIILVSSGRAVLPTVVSRCQKFMFNRFSEKDLQNFINWRGLIGSADCIKYSFGSIGNLVRLLENPESLAELRSYSEEYARVVCLSAGLRMSLVASLSELPEASLKAMLNVWIRQHLSIVKPLGNASIQWCRNAIDAQAQLRTSMNKKFIIERVLLTLPQIKI